MLTVTSNIVFPNGYQDQWNISVKDTTSSVSNSVSKNEDASKTQEDKVSLSKKSKELQKVYEKKETVLEQSYTNETQRLENEFIQAKTRLEKEHTHKKRSLEINVYA